MYKKASKLGLRFQTSRGNLATEQLWQLTRIEVSNAIKAVKKILKKVDDDELSFLEDSTVVDVENQLRFDILKDVYLTMVKEQAEKQTAMDNNAYNKKIIDIIANKKEQALNDMPIAELEKLLKM